MKPREMPWGEEREQIHYMHVNGMTNKWEETHTYGGKLSENITQAVSRDILADAILRCESAGYPVILHVHDEIVSELPTGHGDLARFTQLMAEIPQWATGLPIAVEGWRGKRYRK
jgi:DNA polymerase